MNHNFKMVLVHAMENIKRELHQKQKDLLLKERFGTDAVCNPLFFKAGDKAHHKAVYGELEEQYKEQMEFAKELQKMMDQVEEMEWNAFVDAFLKQKK